jgi:superfamily II DNA or RNA helicase
MRAKEKIEMILRHTLTPVTLFPYQQEAVQKSSLWHLSGMSQHIIEIPTGGGKTIVALQLAQDLIRMGGNVLFLAPRIELVTQPYRTALRHFFAPNEVGRVQASFNEVDRPLTIATVQTLSDPDRLAALQHGQRGRRFDMIIADEAQFSVTSSWLRLFEQLLVPDGWNIGYSATPYRADGVSLEKVFPDGICYLIDYLVLIAAGYLVEPESYDYSTNIRFGDLDIDSALNAPASNVDRRETEQRLYRSNRYEVAYRAWQERHPDQNRTLIFAANLTDAYLFRKYFRERGITCEVVRGETPQDIREDLYQQLAGGTQLQVLIGFNVLTTGLDIREVTCLIMARPTRNQGLFIQMAGRGLRTAPEINKRRCVIIQLSDEDHTLMTVPALLGDPTRDVTSFRQQLRHELDEATSKDEHEGDTDDTDDKPPQEQSSEYAPYILRQAQKLEQYSTNLFTGRGWSYDPFSGDYTKKVEGGSGGMIRANRILTGYLVSYHPREGKPVQITAKPLPPLEAMAHGQQYSEYLRLQTHYQEEKREQEQQLLRGQSPDAALPIRRGEPTGTLPYNPRSQYGYLKQRKVPIKGDDSRMTQGDYGRIRALMEQHGNTAYGQDGWRVGYINGQVKEWHVEVKPSGASSPERPIKKGREKDGGTTKGLRGKKEKGKERRESSE